MISVRMLCVATGLLVLGALAPAQTGISRPQRLLAELEAIPDMPSRQKKAAVLLKSVNAARIVPAEGLEWAKVYRSANLFKRQRIATTRFLRTAPKGQAAFDAQVMLLDAAVGDRDPETAILALKAAKPVDNANAYKLALTTAEYYAYGIALKDREAGLEALQLASSKVDESALTGDEREKLGYARAVQAAQIQADAGRVALATQTLDRAMASYPADSETRRRLRVMKNQFTIKGKPAPAFIAEAGMTVPDLGSMKGKVVVLSFFAHWSAPTLAQFPDLKKLSTDLKDRGVEVVGLSRFYGYFGDEKDVTKEVEATKVAGFVRDQQLPWTSSMVAKATFDTYGATSVPYLVVIDKTGIVRAAHAGYSPESFRAIRALIEKLLAE